MAGPLNARDRSPHSAYVEHANPNRADPIQSTWKYPSYDQALVQEMVRDFARLVVDTEAWLLPVGTLLAYHVTPLTDVRRLFVLCDRDLAMVV